MKFPDELWLKVFSSLTRAELVNVSLTCQDFYRCAQRELWSAIKMDQAATPDAMADHLRSLCTTLDEKRHIAPMIKTASFLCAYQSSSGWEKPMFIALLLKACRTTATIDLLPHLTDLSIYASTVHPQIVKLVSLHTIRLYRVKPADTELPDGSTVDKVTGTLGRILCMPSLRKVHLECGISGADNDYLVNDASISGNALPINDFSWVGEEGSLAQLEPLIRRLDHPDRIVLDELQDPVGGRVILMEAVHTHATCLKKLVVGRKIALVWEYLVNYPLPHVPSRLLPLDFRAFTALTHLGTTSESVSGINVSFARNLPPQLEVLQLHYLTWYEYGPGHSLGIASNGTLGEVMDDLIRDRSTRHPSLRKIILCDFGDKPGPKLLQFLRTSYTRFEEVGIELEWNMAQTLQQTPLGCSQSSSIAENTDLRAVAATLTTSSS